MMVMIIIIICLFSEFQFNVESYLFSEFITMCTMCDIGIVVLNTLITYLFLCFVLHFRNIFLRSNLVKIGDFGISRILMSNSEMATTFVGTPYYMSPEVLKHEGYNSKSDIWWVFIVCVQCVCTVMLRNRKLSFHFLFIIYVCNAPALNGHKWRSCVIVEKIASVFVGRFRCYSQHFFEKEKPFPANETVFKIVARWRYDWCANARGNSQNLRKWVLTTSTI